MLKVEAKKTTAQYIKPVLTPPFIFYFFNIFFNKTFNTNLQNTDQVGYSKFRHMAFFPSTVLVKVPVFFFSTVQFKEGLRLPVPLTGN